VGITLDTAVPEISLSNFRPTVTVPNLDMLGKVTDTNSFTLQINGNLVDVRADGSFVATVSLVEGTNTITLTATDAAGNTQTITRTVTLDTTPPEVSVNAPAIVTGNESTATITITAPDAVSITVNGIPATSNGDGTWTYNANLNPGGNTFYIVAEDRYGNVGQTAVDITYSAPVRTTVAETGYSTTTTYLAGVGALILGLIIGIVIAMLLWGGKKEEPAEPMEEEVPEEEPEQPDAPKRKKSRRGRHPGRAPGPGGHRPISGGDRDEHVWVT
jgi:hypothetical protein